MSQNHLALFFYSYHPPPPSHTHTHPAPYTSPSLSNNLISLPSLSHLLGCPLLRMCLSSTCHIGLEYFLVRKLQPCLSFYPLAIYLLFLEDIYLFMPRSLALLLLTHTTWKALHKYEFGTSDISHSKYYPGLGLDAFSLASLSSFTMPNTGLGTFYILNIMLAT